MGEVGTTNRFKKMLLVTVALLLLAVAGLYLYKDAAVRAGVIAGGDQVLGADSTTLDTASLDLFGGGLSLRDLKLNNPDGYQQPHFFQLGGIDVDVSLGSLLASRIVVPKIDLNGVELLVESVIDQDGLRLNLLTIRDQLRSSRVKNAEANSVSAGQRFVIESLTVSDLKVMGLMTIPRGGSWPIDLDVPTFEIRDIGQKQKGVLLAEVVGIILDAMIDKAIDMIEADGSDKLKVAGDVRRGLEFFNRGLKESGLDPKLGKKLLDDALKKGFGDLLKKKKDR